MERNVKTLKYRVNGGTKKCLTHLHVVGWVALFWKAHEDRYRASVKSKRPTLNIQLSTLKSEPSFITKARKNHF